MARLPRFPIVLAVVAVLLTAACGGDTTNKPTSVASGGAGGSPASPVAAQAKPANREVILATTTSTVDTGLLDELGPLFEKGTGYRLTVLAQGSGAALKTGERGEADVILAHSPDAEQAFMAAGHGTRRELVMHNDFVLVGPAKDPAGVREAAGARDAMQRIAAAGATFISRGDNSGTHALELKLWREAGVEPRGGSWYQESGSGMGGTLQVASEKDAYTISDRGTYLSLRTRLALAVLHEGDAALRNVYHVIQVNPAKSARVNADGATAFIQFLIAPETQRRIGEYGRDRFGQPLFTPDYGKEGRARE